jgi:hypothetical protein
VSDLIPSESDSTKRVESDDDLEVGQWYWVKQYGQDYIPNPENPDDEDDEILGPVYDKLPWLVCIVRMGSNYAKVQGVGNAEQRIHFDEFYEECTRENNPKSVIGGKLAQHQEQAGKLMDKVKQLTARLGIAPRSELAEGGEAPSHALAVAHGTDDIKAHKNALIKAKEETLPDLFEKIGEEHEAMAMWMKAELIPMQAEASKLSKRTEVIEDRIFTVELYAGLTEDLIQIKKGKPADNDEKVRLFQRRHYMDEECLAEYESGGMDYKSIKGFNRWLTKKKNLNRILPHPRCVVAFKVRRERKERQGYSLEDFIKIAQEDDADKETFLYIRNGSQVFMLATSIDFGEELFPDTDHSSILGGGNLYMETSWSRIKKLIGESEYQDILARRQERKDKYVRDNAAWEALTEKQKKSKISPWYHGDSDKWEAVEPGNLYYDDAMRLIAADAKAHNRVAVVLQGLLDRSPAFQPHPPWRLWEAAGFANGVELIHDCTRVLVDGDPPDFEAYRDRLNLGIVKGTHTVGQEDLWLRREADKEYDRQRSDYRIKNPYHQTHFYPYGNPGPDHIDKVSKVGRKGKIHFSWQRERQTLKWVTDPDKPGYMKPDESGITTHFECSASSILNVEAYTPGDFRIFYADPRTRQDYLKWAPLLLAAEDWHAKRAKP